MLAHFEQYLRHERHLSEGTITNYLSFMKEYVDFIQMNPDHVKRENIRDYVIHLKGRGLGNTGMANQFTALRTFYRWRADENLKADLIKLNHFLNYRIKIKKEYTVPYIPSLQEVEKLRQVLIAYQKAMSYAPQSEGYFGVIRDRAMIELLISAGMRSNELRNIRYKDVDLERGMLLIQKGKGGKQRYALFNGKTMQVLKEFFKIKQFQAEDILFPFRQGNLLNYVIKKWAKKANINYHRIHAHSFRHLFITRLMAQGWRERDVADLVGHVDLNTTRRYTHLNIEYLKKKYDQCEI